MELPIKETLSYKIFENLKEQLLDCVKTTFFIFNNFFHAVEYIFTGKINFKNTLEQSAKFGFDSLLITLSMVGIAGMIIALQIASEMVKQGAGDYVGSLVTASIVREIGPVIGGFAIISMVGSSMAAEIGTMKVTEQIDAMKVLKVDPMYYLIVPRILAGFFTMPFVIVFANVSGIMGGMLTSNMVSDLGVLSYIDSVWHGVSERDIFISLLKACVFGGAISLVSSSIGYSARGGAIGVGRATTKSVVWSFTWIVILDYIVSLIFFE